MASCFMFETHRAPKLDLTKSLLFLFLFFFNGKLKFFDIYTKEVIPTATHFLQIYSAFKDRKSHCSDSDILRHNSPSNRAKEVIQPSKHAEIHLDSFF